MIDGFFIGGLSSCPTAFPDLPCLAWAIAMMLFNTDELSATSIVSCGDEAMDFEAALSLYLRTIRDRASISVLAESPWFISQYSTASDSIALNVSHSGTLVTRP